MTTPINPEALPLTNCSAVQKCAERIAGHIAKPLDIYAIVSEIESDEYSAELMLQHLILWAAKTERHSNSGATEGCAPPTCSRLSDTPETSAAWHDCIAWCNQRDEREDPHHVALANLAEKLERDRDRYASLLCEAMRVVYAAGGNDNLIERFEKLELTPSFSSAND